MMRKRCHCCPKLHRDGLLRNKLELSLVQQRIWLATKCYVKKRKLNLVLVVPCPRSFTLPPYATYKTNKSAFCVAYAPISHDSLTIGRRTREFAYNGSRRISSTPSCQSQLQRVPSSELWALRIYEGCKNFHSCQHAQKFRWTQEVCKRAPNTII